MNFNRYMQGHVTVGRKRTELKGFNQVDLSTQRTVTGMADSGEERSRSEEIQKRELLLA
jgi:hypothetical protein